MTGLLPLYDAAEMRDLDERAMGGLGIPGAVLMEGAGRAAALELLARYPQARRVAVVCGQGNNGGDGFVVARVLRSAGIDVETLMVGQARRLGIDARGNMEICRRLDIPVEQRPSAARLRAALRRADVAVDALFGTGFTGEPRAPAAAAIAALNRSARPVVALDVPSGLDASNGTVAGECVRAELTVTFHGPKTGLLIAPGSRHAGEVVVADIGIPPALERPTACMLATAEVLAAVPRRGPDASKYAAGSVLVMGGAPGMTGAPLLAGKAAMRAGAGVAWIATSEEVAASIGSAVPELMVRPLPGGLELTARAGAVVLGPGIGRAGDSERLVRRVLREHRGPLVLDADGLFALGDRPESLGRRRAPVVLTPHAGELARLIGIDSATVEAGRLAAVREAARRANATVLLKGADTLVADPRGRVVVCSSRAYGLATAGSGDVLSGVIGSLLARGLGGVEAAVAGAVAHARAGLLAQERLGPDGIMAGDVIDRLPEAFARS